MKPNNKYTKYKRSTIEIPSFTFFTKIGLCGCQCNYCFHFIFNENTLPTKLANAKDNSQFTQIIESIEFFKLFYNKGCYKCLFKK